MPAKGKVKKKSKKNLKYVGLALGAAFIAFLLGLNLILPLLDNKTGIFQENIAIDKNTGTVGEIDFWYIPEKEPGQIVAAPAINWSKFWNVFKEHALWRLEGLNPNTGEWVDATELLTITRDYPTDESCKIGLQFTTPDNGLSLDWRLSLAVDYRIKKYVNRTGDYEYTLKYEAHGNSFNVSFNWSDMLQYDGLIYNHGIKEVDGDNYFWFRVRRNNVPPNFFVDIDPEYTVTSAGGDLRPSYAGSRCMGRLSNGTIYVAYDEHDDREIWIAFSEDDGATWSNSKIFDGGSFDCFYPTLAIDSNDTIHIVFYWQYGGSYWYYLNYMNSSDNFEDYTVVNVKNNNYEYYPSLAIDSNDNLHLVAEKSAQGPSSDDQVVYYRSKDNGVTWNTNDPILLTNEDTPQMDWWDPIICVDANDRLHAFWHQEAPTYGPKYVSHVYSDDCGDTWTAYDTDAYDYPSQYDGRAYVAISENGTLYGTSTEQYSNDDWSELWENSSSSWVQIGDPGYFDTLTQPDISLDADGNIWLLGLDDDGTDAYETNSTGWSDGTLVKTSINRVKLLYSLWPQIDGVRTNVPQTGYCGIMADYNVGIYYIAHPDLAWQTAEAGESWNNKYYWSFDYSNTSTFENKYYWSFDYSNTASNKQGYYWNFDYSNTASNKQGYYWNFDYSNTASNKQGYYWNFDYSNTSSFKEGFNTWSFDYSNTASNNQGYYWNFDYSNTSTFKNNFYWNFDYSNISTFKNNFYWSFDYSYLNGSRPGFYWSFDYSNSTPVTYIIIKGVYPANNSVNIPLQPNVYATFEHIYGDKMNVSLYYGPSLDNTNTLLDNYSNIDNSTLTALLFTASARSTNYYWRINANDGDTETNLTLKFKSEY